MHVVSVSVDAFAWWRMCIFLVVQACGRVDLLGEKQSFRCKYRMQRHAAIEHPNLSVECLSLLVEVVLCRLEFRACVAHSGSQRPEVRHQQGPLRACKVGGGVR